MRLGYFPPRMGPAAGPDALVAVARRAEELGYDSLWVTERILFPLEPSVPYVASADGSLPMLANIREQADAHGRDGAAIELVVRANLHVADGPLGDDRFIFTGTPDQIRADVEACRAAGAAEVDIGISFDPRTRTPDDDLRGLETWAEVARGA